MAPDDERARSEWWAEESTAAEIVRARGSQLGVWLFVPVVAAIAFFLIVMLLWRDQDREVQSTERAKDELAESISFISPQDAAELRQMSPGEAILDLGHVFEYTASAVAGIEGDTIGERVETLVDDYTETKRALIERGFMDEGESRVEAVVESIVDGTNGEGGLALADYRDARRTMAANGYWEADGGSLVGAIEALLGDRDRFSASAEDHAEARRILVSNGKLDGSATTIAEAVKGVVFDLKSCEHSGGVVLREESPIGILSRSVNFDFDSWQLGDSAMAAIEQLALLVKSLENEVVVGVTGHADQIGNDRYNLWLGQMRAEEVRRQLENRGLSVASTDSKGEIDPLDTRDSCAAMALNRRVEFELLPAAVD